ncbi:MAG: hypothetical protein AAF544_02650 [Bacteroidota bacterium]
MQQLVLLILVTCCFCWSCSADTEGGVDLRITGKESKIIDSIMQAESPIMREYLDSLCDAEMEGSIAAATDSIVQERLEEEARLRARRPLEDITGN